MTGNEIRQRYLDYFQQHGHRVVRSSSLIPQDDPTLLFTNAGMVQFKRTFLGEEKRITFAPPPPRNASEPVVNTTTWKTWAIRPGTIPFSKCWELLLRRLLQRKGGGFCLGSADQWYGLPADKLWLQSTWMMTMPTTYWHKRIGIPESRMIRLGEAENFWAMGDTGPCGPCSEIHLDRGAEHGCGRARLRCGLRLRPVSGNMEPGIHAVQP